MKRLLLIIPLCCLALLVGAQNGYYYQPAQGWCGDPMPFYDESAGEFRVYYLQEYRPNDWATYHPVHMISTTDFVNYGESGVVLPTGNRWAQDAAIGTGSVIKAHTGTYYFYYTGNKYQPSESECHQVIMCATSTDGINWTKTSFRLAPDTWYYYHDDFRDPEVFRTEDGVYHMLIATGKDDRNVLAHFTSSDCYNWTHIGIFMTTLWDRFYECPNVFKMGDWWYLVYSELHREIRRVQYFKATTFAGLAACTANDNPVWPDDHEGYLDSRGFYAGKTASDGTNRYMWGWCPTRREDNNTAVNNDNGEPDWAGTLVAHRLIQHTDGSLTLGEIEPVRTWFNDDVEVSTTSASLVAGGSLALPSLSDKTHLSFTVTASSAQTKFGVSVAQESWSGRYYSLIVNPEANNMAKVNFEQEGPDAMGFLPYIDGYFFSQPTDRVYHIDIYIDRSVFVLYINDQVCYTNRIYGLQNKPWTIRCYNGSVQITDIRQQINDPDKTTDLSVVERKESASKRLENGQLIIYRDGHRYTPMGQKL